VLCAQLFTATFLFTVVLDCKPCHGFIKFQCFGNTFYFHYQVLYDVNWIDCSLLHCGILVLLVNTKISEEDAVFIYRVELSVVRIQLGYIGMW
jgi:hypothetical protein